MNLSKLIILASSIALVTSSVIRPSVLGYLPKKHVKGDTEIDLQKILDGDGGDRNGDKLIAMEEDPTFVADSWFAARGKGKGGMGKKPARPPLPPKHPKPPPRPATPKGQKKKYTRKMTSRRPTRTTRRTKKTTKRRKSKPPRPPPTKYPRSTKRRATANRGKFDDYNKDHRGGRYNDKNTGDGKGKKRNKKGYGYDEKGEPDFYHEDMGDGDYVDERTGRKKPGFLSYAGNAMYSAAGLVNGDSGKQYVEESYYNEKGEWAPPPEDADPEDEGYFASYGMRKKTKTGWFSDLTSLAALSAVPILLCCCGGLGLAAFKRRGGGSDSESESEAAMPRGRVRQLLRKRLRMAKIRGKKKKARRPVPAR